MNDRWEFNGPEEGDTIDMSVIIMFDGEEVAELTESGDHTLEERKQAARLICDTLNNMGALAI